MHVATTFGDALIDKQHYVIQPKARISRRLCIMTPFSPILLRLTHQVQIRNWKKQLLLIKRWYNPAANGHQFGQRTSGVTESFCFCKDGKPGEVCWSVESSNISSVPGSLVEDEWVTCQITPNGRDHEQLLCSLRKKIFKYKNSTAHKDGEKTVAQYQENKALKRPPRRCRSMKKNLHQKQFHLC